MCLGNPHGGGSQGFKWAPISAIGPSMKQLAAMAGDEDVDPPWSPAARRRRASKTKGNGDAAPHHGWRAKAFERAPLASSPGHVQQFPIGASSK